MMNQKWLCKFRERNFFPINPCHGEETVPSVNFPTVLTDYTRKKRGSDASKYATQRNLAASREAHCPPASCKRVLRFTQA